MAILMRPLPRTITTLRERSGRTLRGLALEAGIDAATLCRIEAGESNGRPATLLAIARALGVTIDEITYNSAAGIAA
jgi:transcriptional regulator with XRE-family HTH domain